MLPACRELGIGFVPYSPLGRGFLTGAIQSLEQLDANDWRRQNPRFQADAVAQNLALVDAVKALRQQKGCTPAQLALAWLLGRRERHRADPGHAAHRPARGERSGGARAC